MSPLPNRFFRAALVFFAVGVALGSMMSLTQDFTLRPVHVHVNLLGWVCFFLYGAFYRLFPQAAATKLAVAHFWSAIVGLPPMLVGLGLVVSGNLIGLPLLLTGEALSVVSVVLFVVVGFRATGAPAADATSLESATPRSTAP
ncbi:hypothetical protein ACTZWW_12395 [Salinarimonas sp. NSM]|uniref:hypothetical protein n=1 Tax=Salinarimonas sp. NSM TaxID=3458003 RepID=UPI004036B401